LQGTGSDEELCGGVLPAAGEPKSGAKNEKIAANGPEEGAGAFSAPVTDMWIGETELPAGAGVVVVVADIEITFVTLSVA